MIFRVLASLLFNFFYAFQNTVNLLLQEFLKFLNHLLINWTLFHKISYQAFNCVSFIHCNTLETKVCNIHIYIEFGFNNFAIFVSWLVTIHWNVSFISLNITSRFSWYWFLLFIVLLLIIIISQLLWLIVLFYSILFCFYVDWFHFNCMFFFIFLSLS